MLLEIVSKKTFFFAVERQVSTTGWNPSRGLYYRLEDANGGVYWLDNQKREVMPDWAEKLESKIGD